MTDVNVQDLIQKVDQISLPPVVLFCPYKAQKAREPSFEPFLAEEAVDKIVNAAIDPSMRDLAYSSFYADETPPAEVVLEAQTLPFLAERRVIVVRNAQRYNFESQAGPVWHYIEHASESSLLLLIASQIDRRTKFFKLCGKHGLVVECPMLRETEADAWLRERAQQAGKNIAPPAAAELIRRAGLHLSDINNALNIAVAYVGTEPLIREQDVVKSCADVAEEEVWTLTDAIAMSQPATALASLRKLIDMGKHQDELIGAINWVLKSAYQAAAPGAPSISPFVSRKVQGLVNKLGIKKLRDALILVNDTHFMMRSTGVDENLALELLVVKLAAPRQK